MKTKIEKTVKKRNEFNVHATPEDIDRIKRLREKHGVNLSGVFKVFLEHLEKQLDKIDYDSGIKP